MTTIRRNGFEFTPDEAARMQALIDAERGPVKDAKAYLAQCLRRAGIVQPNYLRRVVADLYALAEKQGILTDARALAELATSEARATHELNMEADKVSQKKKLDLPTAPRTADNHPPADIKMAKMISALDLSQYGPAVQTQYRLAWQDDRIDKIVVGNDGHTLYTYSAKGKRRIAPDAMLSVEALPVVVNPLTPPPVKVLPEAATAPLARRDEATVEVPAGFVLEDALVNYVGDLLKKGGMDNATIDQQVPIIISEALDVPATAVVGIQVVQGTKAEAKKKLEARAAYALAEYANLEPMNAEQGEPEPMPKPVPQQPVTPADTDARQYRTGDASPCVVLFDFPVSIAGQVVTLKLTNRGGTAEELAATIASTIQGIELARQKYPHPQAQPFAPVAPPAAPTNPLGPRPQTISQPVQKPPSGKAWADSVQADHGGKPAWQVAKEKYDAGEEVTRECREIVVEMNPQGAPLYKLRFADSQMDYVRVSNPRDVTMLVHWCEVNDVNFGALTLGTHTIPPMQVTIKRGKEFQPGKFYKDLVGLA